MTVAPRRGIVARRFMSKKKKIQNFTNAHLFENKQQYIRS